MRKAAGSFDRTRGKGATRAMSAEVNAAAEVVERLHQAMNEHDLGAFVACFDPGYRSDVPLVWPSPAGGLLRLDNFRRREWSPAIEASGVERPARIYDLRSTFASNALAAGVTVFELARVMGTSVAMIERHYGALLDGAHAGIVGRLDALEAGLEQATEAEAR